MAILLLLLSAPDRAPEAAFALEDGFLSVKVSRGGARLEARLKAYDGPNVVAEGETDAEGKGMVMSFKPGQWCLVSRDGRVAWANRGDEPFTENRTLLVEIARLEGRK
ncbi:MAG: hypothetical protein K2W96_28570, partial [Gemmataceae bacterium]|nr:hypothetical protein [Gemmataceae bacterium]